jgi:hypothetical protein
MSGARVGEVSHFFDRISVAVITLTSTLHKGDIAIKVTKPVKPHTSVFLISGEE